MVKITWSYSWHYTQLLHDQEGLKDSLPSDHQHSEPNDSDVTLGHVAHKAWKKYKLCTCGRLPICPSYNRSGYSAEKKNKAPWSKTTCVTYSDSAAYSFRFLKTCENKLFSISFLDKSFNLLLLSWQLNLFRVETQKPTTKQKELNWMRCGPIRNQFLAFERRTPSLRCSWRSIKTDSASLSAVGTAAVHTGTWQQQSRCIQTSLANCVGKGTGPDWIVIVSFVLLKGGFYLWSKKSTRSD